MKRVKRQELRDLIWEHYLNKVRRVPMLDAYKQPIDTIYALKVDTICIQLYDKKPFDSKLNQESFLQDFANAIEEITLGNLKVVNMGCAINENDGSYLTWVHIASAYEVID